MWRFVDLLAIYTSSGGAPSSGGRLKGVLRERQICLVYIGLNGIYLCSEYTRGGMDRRGILNMILIYDLERFCHISSFLIAPQLENPTVPLRSATSEDLAIVRFQISINIVIMPVHNGDVVALKDREEQGWWCPTPFFKLIPILLYDDDTSRRGGSRRGVADSHTFGQPKLSPPRRRREMRPLPEILDETRPIASRGLDAATLSVFGAPIQIPVATLLGVHLIAYFTHRFPVRTLLQRIFHLGDHSMFPYPPSLLEF
ncbi:uncharacterized protein CLUP02_03175 [Colletotrichum lupini]|uniref:Uncharacterized protein n=1 Tax=Colletotrichum lupini TaxID=145971 RepID=A0A9Q8SHX8_9PEZI|nr:uncharacterized protein CLUP02_03175 [Colletotrichum lupini]UQC77704.1 hypothetical protein CLUP02_03175 [Colletotrichum lupini]